MARALFFGRLRDAAGCSAREVALEHATDVAAFRRLLCAGDTALEAVLASPTVRVAVNATLLPSAETGAVAPNDEVAFMPPFSGG
ncbi:MAG: MoaD/ThiS family protein [Hyphomonadaceae bacterium]|nr:MoaD/ThiS family protein [Hyphomonadaceae bacterium]